MGRRYGSKALAELPSLLECEEGDRAPRVPGEAEPELGGFEESASDHGSELEDEPWPVGSHLLKQVEETSPEYAERPVVPTGGRGPRGPLLPDCLKSLAVGRRDDRLRSATLQLERPGNSMSGPYGKGCMGANYLGSEAMAWAMVVKPKGRLGPQVAGFGS